MEWTLDHPATLLEALKKRYPESTANTLRGWIQQGRIAVDGAVAHKPSQTLVTGQILQVSPQGHLPSRSEGRYGTIIYEDRYLAVVDKKVGALSVATDLDRTHTVHAQLKERYGPQGVYVVHRLDQGTSGLMVFAREAEAFNQLKRQLAAHIIKRQYIAVVTGVPKPPEGSWRCYLSEDSHYYVHSSDDPSKGEEAITHYRTLAQSGGYTILQLTLATGKKNQIRVHCQRAGHPIIGDEKYGGDVAAMPRLGLHAYALSFMHPKTHHPMAFTSAVPRCFAQLVPARLWVHGPITLTELRRARR